MSNVQINFGARDYEDMRVGVWASLISFPDRTELLCGATTSAVNPALVGTIQTLRSLHPDITHVLFNTSYSRLVKVMWRRTDIEAKSEMEAKCWSIILGLGKQHQVKWFESKSDSFDKLLAKDALLAGHLKNIAMAREKFEQLFR